MTGCDPVLVTRRVLPHLVLPRHLVDGGVVIVPLDVDVNEIEAKPPKKQFEIDNGVAKLDACICWQNSYIAAKHKQTETEPCVIP